MAISGQIALTVIIYFGQAIVFSNLINKNVLVCFLLIRDKEHAMNRSTNVFNKNHRT